MDSEVKPRKRKAYPDRITLSEEALKRVNAWVSQLNLELPSVGAKKADLVSWYLCQAPEVLSASMVKSLQEAFFDEIEHEKWLLKEMQSARARGEPHSRGDILKKRIGMTDPSAQPVQKRRRKPKAISEEAITSDSTKLLNATDSV